jgi:phosphonate transport system substrate-binding protein
MIRPLVLGLSLAAALALAACGQKPAPTEAPKEIVFSILSAENQASSGPLWQPLLDDMSAQIGVKVKPYFATNYTSLIEAMRFKQVQVGWFSALTSLEAINRSDGEVLGRIVNTGGSDTYTSVPNGLSLHAKRHRAHQLLQDRAPGQPSIQ